MEDKFLQAVEQLRKEGDMESLLGVLKVINSMMSTGGQIVTPIDIPADIGEGEVKAEDIELKHLTMDGKVKYLAAFTSMDEHKKGPEGAALFMPMREIVDTAFAAGDIEGIVINPWSSSFILSKDLISILMDMNKSKTVRASQVSGDFYVHMIDERPVNIIDAVKTKMPEFENVSRVYITGLNNNGKESYLLMVEFADEEPDSLFEKILAALPAGENGLKIDVTPYTGDIPGVAELIYQK
jgi:hypothetical protein